MAGIDSNTLLYLRGDSFVDLSLNNYTVSNDDGMTLTDSDNFGKALDLTVESKRLNILDAVLPTDMFTIDWWEISKGASTANTALVSTLDDTHTDTSIKGIIMGKSSASAGPKLWSTTPSQTSSWVVSAWSFGNANTSNWVHRALVYDGTTFYAYENGKLFGTATCEGLAAPSPSHIIIGAYRASSACYNAHVENLRISNNVRWTEDFEPPTKPYTSVSLSILNQNDNEFNFSVTKESVNESIDKVDVILNGNVVQTYTEGFDNIDYSIDKDACYLGGNDVEIRAYYYNDFYESDSFVYNNSIDKLEEQPSLPEIVDKLNEIKNNYSIINDNLYNILLNEGFDVTVEYKRTNTLVRKVGEFTDGIKEKLVEVLITKDIDCSTSNTFEELVSKIESSIIAPSWANNVGLPCAAAEMTTARRFLTSAVLGNNIYAIGGYTGSASSLNEMYDTVTNTWTTKKALTVATYAGAAVACNGSIYHLGGYSYTTSHYMYSPSTNTWTGKTALPNAKQYSAAVEVNGKVYISQGNNTYNMVYDPSTNAWTQLTRNGTTGGNYVSSAYYNGKIYVMGGASYPTYAYSYDIANDTWATIASIPTGFYRAGQHGMVYKDKIYFMCGTYNSATSNKILRYDPTANSWELLSITMPVAAYGPTTEIVNGKMYCIGGYSNTYAKSNQMLLL